MRLELPVRWNEHDKNAEKLNDILNKEEETEPKYLYGTLLIDSEDIGAYYDISPLYTMINDKNGKLYCVGVPIHDLKKIMTEVTGQVILKVHTTQEYKATKPRKKRDDTDGIDDILH